LMFVDELQYVEEEELAALITALHRAAQRQLPVTLVGAGLPQLRAAENECPTKRTPCNAVFCRAMPLAPIPLDSKARTVSCMAKACFLARR
jgi:hypothetical protein